MSVDLLGEFPRRINVGMRKKTREIKEKWITIKYDDYQNTAQIINYKDILKWNIFSFIQNYTPKKRKWRIGTRTIQKRIPMQEGL